MSDVTRILNAIERGETKAADELLPLVYEELRLLAAQKMSQELPGQTLQATALVHEAYIRLVGEEAQKFKSRGHFFTAAAEAMRRILIDNARRKKSLKHGGDHQRMNLDKAVLTYGGEPSADDLIALNEALCRLAEHDAIPKAPARSSGGISCWRRSARGAWRWCIWPSRSGRSGGRWP
jgi:RNA polymerase sigma factor (TIGR02999 family)